MVLIFFSPQCCDWETALPWVCSGAGLPRLSQLWLYTCDGVGAALKPQVSGPYSAPGVF